jgi:hypothetical protein
MPITTKGIVTLPRVRIFMRRNDLAPHAHRRGAEHDELRFESVVHRGVG